MKHESIESVNAMRQLDIHIRDVKQRYNMAVQNAAHEKLMPNPDERFWDRWPMEDYVEAIEECMWEIKEYWPKRHDPSYRRSLRGALDQARYLGLRDK